tara:strand:- start:167 stop:418 length:252 start_codon:yes stop_codon:yes gene_type:complete
MKDEFKQHPVPDEDALRLNTVRSNLILWIVERFQTLVAENREEDACYFMDEWFEWVNKETYINESTLFFDENEIKELYESIKN